MKSMMGIAKEFYEMPVEDRACLYSEDIKKPVRLSTSFNISKEKVLNWRDYLLHPCHPLEEFIDSWPEKPAAYRYSINYTLLVFLIAVELLKRLDGLGIELKPVPRLGRLGIELEPVPRCYVYNSLFEILECLVCVISDWHPKMLCL